MLKSILKWFKTEPGSNRPETIDQFSEDTLKIEGAVQTLCAMSKKYGVAGTKEMSLYVGKTIGNDILNSGLRRYEI
jgi:hypothetical protein